MIDLGMCISSKFKLMFAFISCVFYNLTVNKHSFYEEKQIYFKNHWEDKSE